MISFLTFCLAISYAGGTVGSFVFPALIEAVIAEYGLRGSFLIIGGILLNGLPCAMLLRPPIPVDSRRKSSTTVAGVSGNSEVSKQTGTFPSKSLSKRSIRSIHFKLRRRKSGRDKWLFLRKSSIDLFIEKQSSTTTASGSTQQTAELEIGGGGAGFSISTSDAISNAVNKRGETRFESVKTYQKHSKTMSYAYQETELLVMESVVTAKSRSPLQPPSSSPFPFGPSPSPIPFGSHHHHHHLLSPPTSISPSIVVSGSEASASANVPSTFPLFRPELSPTFSAISTATATTAATKTPVTKNKYCQTDIVAKNSYFMAAIVSILSNPMYLILLITHVSFQWAWMTYQMIIFDFAIDLKLSRGQSVSILVGFAVADLIGRVISGWVADRGMIQKNHIVSICILCIGFFIQLTSMISSYRMHLTLSLFLGFTCGTIIVLFNLLTMEYVGLDHLPVALGLSAFFVGVTSLIRPYFIGLFRDVIGSYLGLFRFVGTLAFIAAFLWLMEPFAILHYKRRAKVKVQGSSEEA